MLDRNREREMLDRLVVETRAGQSRVLVLRGEAGIRLCEAAAEVLDKLAQRLQAALDRLQQVPYDLGEVYELVYQFIRKGGKLPVYARWIEGAEAGW